VAGSSAKVVPRWLIFGGYALIALGTAIQMWLERLSPSRFLGFEGAVLIGYVLIGSAWWLCIAELRDAMATRAAVRWGLRLFAVASLVLMAGYLCLISEHAQGWNLVTLGLVALGYLSASCGFWVTTLDRKAELPLDSRIPAAVRQ
jgi:hypothetical protein